MSYRTAATVLDLPEDIPITTTQRFILLVLANYSDEKDSCWPSVERIRKHIGIKSRGTIQRALRGLEDAEYIETEKRLDQSGRQTSNRYVLKLGEGRAHAAPDDTPEGPRPRGGEGRAHAAGEGRAHAAVSSLKGHKEPSENKSGSPSWSIVDYELPYQIEIGSDAHLALQEWLDFRRVAKRKQYSASAWIIELWNRVDKNPERLVAAVRVSIAREWQGIFEDRGSRTQKRHAAPAKVDPSDRKIKTRRTSS